jgi:hypothetical protein
MALALGVGAMLFGVVLIIVGWKGGGPDAMNKNLAGMLKGNYPTDGGSSSSSSSSASTSTSTGKSVGGNTSTTGGAYGTGTTTSGPQPGVSAS